MISPIRKDHIKSHLDQNCIDAEMLVKQNLIIRKDQIVTSQVKNPMDTNHSSSAAASR